MLENIIWDTDEPFDDRSAYVDLLMKANYTTTVFRSTKSRESIVVRENELFTSIRKLAKHWNWSEGKVRRYLKMLENEKLLVVKTHVCGTHLSLINIDKTDEERHTYKHDDEHDDEHKHKHDDKHNDRHDDSIRLKKDKKVKESQESQDPKNTAKRSGFVWEGDPE